MYYSMCTFYHNKNAIECILCCVVRIMSSLYEQKLTANAQIEQISVCQLRAVVGETLAPSSGTKYSAASLSPAEMGGVPGLNILFGKL